MIECRHCGEVSRDDPERLGARCPRCRMPLYDRSDSLRREDSTEGDARCARHPKASVIGVCPQCNLAYCANCRSRWREQTLCLACVEAKVAELLQPPKASPAFRRQAIVSVLLGVVAWAMAVGAGIWLLALAMGQARDSMTVLLGTVALVSLLPSFIGVGQAAAAIRARGRALPLATTGLCLCAAHLGIVVGVLVLPALR